MRGKSRTFRFVQLNFSFQKQKVKRFLFHFLLSFRPEQRERSEKQKTLFTPLIKTWLGLKIERKGRAVSAHQRAKPFQIKNSA